MSFVNFVTKIQSKMVYMQIIKLQQPAKERKTEEAEEETPLDSLHSLSFTL